MYVQKLFKKVYNCVREKKEESLYTIHTYKLLLLILSKIISVKLQNSITRARAPFIF